ncbi:hypothetical protein BBJ28_00008016 [Nothophytophthora sp. Chile5]|nr:hypothetical protein BBJ28_00008016 [Nothophytophthora sp. Chile5]
MRSTSRRRGVATEDDASHIPVIRDEDEWAAWNVVGDRVLHIELKDWADVMLLAPMSANTLGKLANGLADNLLTCVARAWITSKPFIFAPAMNTDMWDHPVTAKQLSVLGEFGYKMVPPVEKKLACGVVGTGRKCSGTVGSIYSQLSESCLHLLVVVHAPRLRQWRSRNGRHYRRLHARATE